MNEVQPLSYIFSLREEQHFPLSHYLPPYYPGMASKLVGRDNLPSTLLLEPLGASPRAILELGASFRVIVNCSNPILAFLIAFLAKELTSMNFQSALAELSILKRGEERLEEHLRSLYLTRCSKCRQEVEAEYFLYRRGESAPFARGYHCPGCGEGGQTATTTEDLEHLVAIQRSYPMHRSRAFARASTGSDDNTKLVNEVLNLYPPRALYFLFTLLNKIDSLKLAPLQKEALDALVLAALDAGHSLNPWPATEEPPRTLAQPEVYIEKNLWQVMETSIAEWANAAKPTPFSEWPAIPPDHGVSLHRGRMRDLAAQNLDLVPDAICSIVPRPYAAFWTFSAVWSTWLWGKEITAGYLGILERRRFDWLWHSTALQSAFSSANKMVKEKSPVFTILPEPFTGLTNAVFNAASASSWSLSGITCAGEALPFQCKWSAMNSPAGAGKSNTQRIIRDAIRKLLMDAGEPQRYMLLHAGVMAALTLHHSLPQDLDQLRGEYPAQISKEIQTIFTDAKFLRHLGSSSSELETGSWWLAQLDELPESISDRVEQNVIAYLRQHKEARFDEVMDHLCSHFTGFLSPADPEVSAILDSYAKLDASYGSWVLNEHDYSQKRSQDIVHIQKLVIETGKKLGYEVSGENPIDLTDDAAGNISYRLFISTTAQLGELARLPMPGGCQYVFLFPGSRAALIKWKIDHNDLLSEITARDWHFLKFRTMRHLAVRPDLSRELWALLIDSDPISPEETTQLSMFNL